MAYLVETYTAGEATFETGFAAFLNTLTISTVHKIDIDWLGSFMRATIVYEA